MVRRSMASAPETSASAWANFPSMEYSGAAAHRFFLLGQPDLTHAASANLL
jgi:hypothetical protein